MPSFKLLLAVCFAAFGTLLAVNYLRGLEPRHPRGGQVVEPNAGGSHLQSGSSTPIVYSLYEYYDPTHFHITGKSIRFAIPDNLTQSIMMSGSGGPAYTIRIHYNPDDEKPCPQINGNKAAFDPCWTGEIQLEVTFSGDIGPWSTQEIQSGKVTELMNGLGLRPRLEQRDESYCGFTSFGRAEPMKPIEMRYPVPHVAPTDPRWPFSDSVVLARSHSDGSMFPVVTCSNDIKGDGFPYCAMRGAYRGWPIRLLFSGRRVCQAEGMLDHANRLLDRFQVSETEGSPGYGENRHLKHKL